MSTLSTQQPAEILTGGTPQARISQNAAEIAYTTSAAAARNTQVVIEFLEAITPPTQVRNTQQPLEYLNDVAQPPLRLTAFTVEVVEHPTRGADYTGGQTDAGDFVY